MTADEVFKSPQFQKLSSQQRTFIKALTENGWDKTDAAKQAWACKDDDSAIAMANRAWRNSRISSIIALIDPAKSRMTKDEALALAAKHARTATKPADVIKCLALISAWEGWEAEKPAPGDVPDENASIYDLAAALERKQQ